MLSRAGEQVDLGPGAPAGSELAPDRLPEQDWPATCDVPASFWQGGLGDLQVAVSTTVQLLVHGGECCELLPSTDQGSSYGTGRAVILGAVLWQWWAQ